MIAFEKYFVLANVKITLKIFERIVISLFFGNEKREICFMFTHCLSFLFANNGVVN